MVTVLLFFFFCFFFALTKATFGICSPKGYGFHSFQIGYRFSPFQTEIGIFPNDLKYYRVNVIKFI